MTTRDVTDVAAGPLVLVVGASGVGKDTLMDGAKRVLSAAGMGARFHFPKRAIARPAHPSEDFVSVPVSAFASAGAEHNFALRWSAHGTQYGVPASIRTDLARGDGVVVNVSRTIVAQAKLRFSNVVVVVVTCAPEIRAQRLAERGRETASEIEARIARTVDDFDPELVDHTIDNSGRADDAIADLTEILRGCLDTDR